MSERFNWGRWGERDQRGTANLITPETIVAAAGLIQAGEAISCAAPLASGLPVAPHRTRPQHRYATAGEAPERTASSGFLEDTIAMSLHSGTHWDALCHCHRDGLLYNGASAAAVGAGDGGCPNSIGELAESLLGRGVLLDLPTHLGRERLDPGEAVTAEQLDACAEAEGVELRSGDIVLLRTGYLAWFLGLDDPAAAPGGEPGVDLSVVEWARCREIAALGADNSAVEVFPADGWEGEPFPVHLELIRDLGLTIGELFLLERLAGACRGDGRYAFFLVAQPLAIPSASGSPINPIALR